MSSTGSTSAARLRHCGLESARLWKRGRRGEHVHAGRRPPWALRAWAPWWCTLRACALWWAPRAYAPWWSLRGMGAVVGTIGSSAPWRALTLRNSMRTPWRSRRRADSCAADEPPNTAPDGRGLAPPITAPPITAPPSPVGLGFASSAVLSASGLVRGFAAPPSAVLSATRRSSSFPFSLAFQLAAAAPDEGRTQS